MSVCRYCRVCQHELCVYPGCPCLECGAEEKEDLECPV